MTRILTGMLLTIAAATGAAAAPNGAPLAAAQDAAARAGFAAADAAAPRIAEPASAAFAGQPSVAITSFEMSGPNSRLGEICGRVSGAASDVSVVRITVDPREKNPAIYNAIAGADGSFCAVVMTYTREADASVKGMSKPAAAAASEGSGR